MSDALTRSDDPGPVAALLDRLRDLGIEARRVDHPPVYTCDEAARLVPDDTPAAHTKNLFLRDQKGRRHWLVVTDCARTVDLKALAPLLGADKLSLASPERLLRYLGVTPGAVTVLGLIADVDRAVELVVDRSVWEMARWRSHPLVNTATLLLERTAVERFLASTGHVPRIVELPARQGHDDGGRPKA